MDCIKYPENVNFLPRKLGKEHLFPLPSTQYSFILGKIVLARKRLPSPLGNVDLIEPVYTQSAVKMYPIKWTRKIGKIPTQNTKSQRVDRVKYPKFGKKV